MEKRTREILALILLVVLGLSVAFGMGWYILVGHNWNRAATHIDDLVGSMDGYTVIVYDGVVKDHKTSSREKASSSSSAASTSSGGNASAKAGEPAGSSPSSASASSTGTNDTGDLASEAAPSASAATAASSSSFAASASSSAGSSASSASSESSASGVDAQAVAESYRDKGAAVVVLGKDCMKRYEEPEILFKNGKRIGVFSFSDRYRLNYARIRADIRYLQDHSVDFIIAIVQDKSFLKGCLTGIDLLVLRRDAGIPETGEFKKSTFCVDSPFLDEVQAVIVSPSGVITSRTVKEL